MSLAEQIGRLQSAARDLSLTLAATTESGESFDEARDVFAAQAKTADACVAALSQALAKMRSSDTLSLDDIDLLIDRAEALQPELDGLIAAAETLADAVESVDEIVSSAA